MASRIDIASRNVVKARFREAICSRMGVVPFPHQAEWWLASDGLEMQAGVPAEQGQGQLVQLADGERIEWAVRPRPNGAARFLADLGAFKVGKSFGSGIWAAGFAAIPGVRINLVGSEYDICAPEFDYICEALLSERGMGLKYESLQNRPRDGKMWLDLENGARYEARSWERKESLKGKEIDAYIYCEAYQLPGIECFTGFKQNLNARRGFAVFATTPDRPWVKLLHEQGHGMDPEWHCTCSVPAEVNSFTFDPRAKEMDKALMTREKYAIHYMGQIGDFVGRVFNYSRGQVQFSSGTNPELFKDSIDDLDHLALPNDWEIVCGADTGTYYTALAVAFSPSGDAYVIAEWPNYRYVAGLPERDEDITIPEWARQVEGGVVSLGGRAYFWADKNSQFKRELQAYGLTLLPASTPVETRTEITREYFQQGKIHLAPWLSILPFELENAAWPEEASAAGKFARIKDRDHTLDCLEHILSRRPRGRHVEVAPKAQTWLESTYKGHRKLNESSIPGLGRN